jgi:hypothetical protein
MSEKQTQAAASETVSTSWGQDFDRTFGDCVIPVAVQRSTGGVVRLREIPHWPDLIRWIDKRYGDVVKMTLVSRR